jgi:hypothetical protein
VPVPVSGKETSGVIAARCAVGDVCRGTDCWSGVDAAGGAAEAGGEVVGEG